VKREKVGSAQTLKAVPLLKVDVNDSCLAADDKCLQNTKCLEINLRYKYYASVAISLRAGSNTTSAHLLKMGILSFLRPKKGTTKIFQSFTSEIVTLSISQVLFGCLYALFPPGRTGQSSHHLWLYHCFSWHLGFGFFTILCLSWTNGDRKANVPFGTDYIYSKSGLTAIPFFMKESFQL